MRLTIKLINSDASLNNFQEIPFLSINKGETVNLNAILWDSEKDIRYIPASGATLYVEISRFPEYFADSTFTTRTTQDYSVVGYATQAFSGDNSMWQLQLTAAQTTNITSSAVRFTLTEGTSIKIATVPQAIKASNTLEQ